MKNHLNKIISDPTYIGTMIISILMACTKRGLLGFTDPIYTQKFAESYNQFVEAIKTVQTFFKTNFGEDPEFVNEIEQIHKIRQIMELRAIYLSSISARNKECADVLSKSEIITHFLTDCSDILVSTTNSVFIASVLIYDILIKATDVSIFLKYFYLISLKK